MLRSQAFCVVAGAGKLLECDSSGGIDKNTYLSYWSLRWEEQETGAQELAEDAPEGTRHVQSRAGEQDNRRLSREVGSQPTKGFGQMEESKAAMITSRWGEELLPCSLGPATGNREGTNKEGASNGDGSDELTCGRAGSR